MTGDMPADEFRKAGHELIDWIADYLADPRQYPVLPDTKPGGLTGQLPLSAPEQGEPMERILGDFHEQVLPAITHWNHPRFHAYFAVSASGPGVLAELLTAALNVNGMLWKSAPAATELEQVTLSWLRQWLGLGAEWFGIIHDTASASTFHAILAAREWKGASAELTMYISEQAHSSVEKGAMILGIRRDHVRAIPTDDEFRMRPELLREAIAADKAAGKMPFFVVATTGTTSTTSVDPVAEISDIATAEGLWLHIDAAYGGAMAMLPEASHFFAGIERADSLVVNPHKWFFVPIDLSVFYTRHPDILRRACSLVPEYLRTWEKDEVVNYMDYGLPLGRRFRALKLWFVMRYFGREGVAARIREHVAMAQRLRREVEADPRFEIMAPTPMALVCFRYRGTNEENQTLMEAINGTRQWFISHTVLHGQFTLRVAIGNLRTTWEDIAGLWAYLQESAARLSA